MQYTKPQRAVIATPATATEALHTSVVMELTAHYTTILTPTLMIAHRRGCYATVINSTINGNSLEATLGTVNAKVATEQVLSAVTIKFSAITIK